MEREQVKKILMFCRNIDGEILYNKKQLDEYEDSYYNIGSSGNIDGMPRGYGKTSNPTESTALNMQATGEAIIELGERIEALTNLKVAILQELNKLPLHQKSILHDFYISGLQWVQISARICYGETQCRKIRNRAIDNLVRYFEANEIIKNFNYPNERVSVSDAFMW